MWYVIQTKPKEEFRALENLQAQGYEVFLPTCTVEHKLRTKLVSQTEPLFRRYMFIALDQVTSNWYPIRSTRGVSSLLRFGDKPVEVRPEIIQELKNRTLTTPSIKEYFSVNDALIVKSGPFVGLSGFFERIIHQASGEVRALLLVELLGKQQKLSLPISDIAFV